MLNRILKKRTYKAHSYIREQFTPSVSKQNVVFNRQSVIFLSLDIYHTGPMCMIVFSTSIIFFFRKLIYRTQCVTLEAV